MSNDHPAPSAPDGANRAAPSRSEGHGAPAAWAAPAASAGAGATRAPRRRWLAWGVAVGLAACALGGPLLMGAWFAPVSHHVVAVDESLVAHERLGYSPDTVLGGWLRLDVQGSQRIDMGSYSKSADQVLRNRLFVQVDTGEQRWLFADHRQLLMPLRELTHARPDGAAHDEPLATLYQVVRTDSNGDGRLSRQDLAELYLTRPDGTDGVWLGPPEPLHDVSVLHTGDWLLLRVANTADNAVLARFNLRQWRMAEPWPLPPLVSASQASGPSD